MSDRQEECYKPSKPNIYHPQTIDRGKEIDGVARFIKREYKVDCKTGAYTRRYPKPYKNKAEKKAMRKAKTRLKDRIAEKILNQEVPHGNTEN